jgi:hypothetical protein
MEPVDCRSSPDVKIALFRSLFRGRDDAVVGCGHANDFAATGH